MDVLELLKRSLDHLIDKQPRPFKLNDLKRQSLTHAKMGALKGHRLPKAQLSLLDISDNFLVGLRRSLRMDPDVTHQVKADIERSLDHSFQFEHRHFALWPRPIWG
jgi:hypothetical protein